MKVRYYILSLLVLLSAHVFGQAKFIGTASKTIVGTGGQFEVSYTINTNADDFTPPNITGLHILSGPNVSNSFESINGQSSQSTTISYIIMAIKEGNFTIGPASVVANGTKLTSNSIQIRVVKGQPVPQNNGGGGQSVASNANTQDLSKSLFLRAVIDKDNVYQGQKITLTYKVYFRVDILQNQVNKLPDLTGFWNEDVKMQQHQPRVETYKGVKYNVADVKQTLLFPEHAGKITIDPFEISFVARVRVATGDIMDQFFGGNVQDVNYTAKSLPVVVRVKPLPEAGKPDSYTGAVGNFNVEASVDKSELKANEALNYKIKVTGAGNIKLLKNLNPVFPADFEKYDPKIIDTVNGGAGSRIYNYLLIPRHKGDFTIPEVKFSYFNPANGKYTSLSTKPFNIKVNKGLTENNVTAFSEDKQDVKLLDKDIHYIKTGDAGLIKLGDGFYGSLPYYLLLLLGPVVCAGAFVYRNRMRKENSDVVKVKSRRASKIAAKHLANAQTELQANNIKAFYEAIFKGLYGYLSDKLNITYAGLDRETISSALKVKTVNDNVIGQLLDTLDLCEMARYAPVTHISAQEVYEKAKNTIDAIENEI